jgi:hypothetical protein
MWKEARLDLGNSSGPINHNELAILQLKKIKTLKESLLKNWETFVDGNLIKSSKIHD